MSPAPERLQFPGHLEVWRVPCADSVAFVAIHALVGGRAFGGIRIRSYPNEQAALDDALDLSRAMSRKLALAGIAGGGAKSVLLMPQPGAPRRDALAALGAFVERLDGRYHCGPDLGFGPEDDTVLRAATRFMAPQGMSGSTARGVEIALRAACPDVASVAVQGLGTVGRPLALSLQAAGVDVVGADLQPVDDVRCVDPGTIHAQSVDVFAPCAVGGVISAQSLPELGCRVVCGGANNPLARGLRATDLAARGVIFVPDVIATSGAAIVGASTLLGEQSAIEERMLAIGPLVQRVLRLARAQGRGSDQVAAELADQALLKHQRA